MIDIHKLASWVLQPKDHSVLVVGLVMLVTIKLGGKTKMHRLMAPVCSEISVARLQIHSSITTVGNESAAPGHEMHGTGMNYLMVTLRRIPFFILRVTFYMIPQ